MLDRVPCSGKSVLFTLRSPSLGLDLGSSLVLTKLKKGVYLIDQIYRKIPDAESATITLLDRRGRSASFPTCGRIVQCHPAHAQRPAQGAGGAAGHNPRGTGPVKGDDDAHRQGNR